MTSVVGSQSSIISPNPNYRDFEMSNISHEFDYHDSIDTPMAVNRCYKEDAERTNFNVSFRY